MKYVCSGNGKLPLVTLIAILSVSLTVNLPGLAISPIMGKLKDVFPHASQLQIQMLSVMSNLIIIPFILFSGKLATRRNQSWVLSAGLALFAASGILYFFADSMTSLIVISCLLGVGCGLVIPIAAGLIAEHFSGEPKRTALGMESGVSNGMVILATLFVGWMADFGWHACFAVYLIPVIPLALMPYMSNRFIGRHAVAAAPSESAAPAQPVPVGKRPIGRLLGLIGLYIGLTYGVIVFSYYLPFTMKHYGLPTHAVGVASAMFYLTATLGGFLLPYYLRVFRRLSPYLALAVSAAGVFMLGFVHTYAFYIIGVLLIGFGYGIVQPIIYNKTSDLSTDKARSTRNFSYVLIGNYIAIAVAPFIVEFFEYLFNDHSVDFPYLLNGTVLVILLVTGIIWRRSYVWRVKG